MPRLMLAFIAGSITLAVAAALSLAGEWEVEAQFDDGTLAGGGFDCTIKQDGDRLTGTCSGGSAPLNGEIHGQSVTWKVLTTTYQGTANEAGTRIEGRFVADGQAGGFYAAKVQ